MDLFTADSVHGDMIRMKRTNPLHMDATGNIPKQQQSAGTGFSQAFTAALQGVNDLQMQSTDLAEQMIIDPESIEPHDVTIAMAKANTALQMTKTILEIRDLRTYFYIEQGELDTAHEYVERASSQKGREVYLPGEPQVSEAHCTLSRAIILWEMGQAQDALARLAAARREDPFVVRTDDLAYDHFWGPRALAAVEAMLAREASAAPPAP